MTSFDSLNFSRLGRHYYNDYHNNHNNNNNKNNFSKLIFNNSFDIYNNANQEIISNCECMLCQRHIFP